jgi:N-sulfoglucosamine sulfohydrolase
MTIGKNQLLSLAFVSLTACSITSNASDNLTGINILLITADDMNYNSVGVFGCPIGGTTPNLDKLAGQGVRFTNAHVNIAVCQPSRGAIMTGMYGHNSGVEGFEYYKGNKPTMTERLRDAGYLTGMLGKVSHSVPKFDTEAEKFDMIKRGLTGDNELGFGRDPQKYYEHAKSFFLRAKKENKPFFLMANSHDPHRPFAGSDDEKQKFNNVLEKGLIPNPSKIFKAEEIEVPAFLPDLPDIRKEIAQYYSSVRRCDDTVGKILQALEESGLQDKTLVIYISDNGMAFPFSKTNCYLNSTKTPFIARWPGRIIPGVDSVHFISAIDFLPTFLEIAGITPPGDIDGVSFLPLLNQKPQKNREVVFTQFYETSAKERYEMRAVQNKQHGYIFNPWSNGKTRFRNESQAGLTFMAMKEVASENKEIARRVNLFEFRVVEEFYDFRNDPDALHNLIDDPSYRQEISELRKELIKRMKDSNDPAYNDFVNQLKK